MQAPILLSACGRPPARPFVPLGGGTQRRRHCPPVRVTVAAAGAANPPPSPDAAAVPPPAVLLDAATLANRDLRGTVAVTGAGPAGLAAAAALGKAGLPVVLLEQGEQLPAGGSALGLWTNAWRALEALGAADQLRSQHPVLPG